VADEPVLPGVERDPRFVAGRFYPQNQHGND
jgi:hypothetical protein